MKRNNNKINKLHFTCIFHHFMFELIMKRSIVSFLESRYGN